MERAAFGRTLDLKVADGSGEVVALVAVTGNIDAQGDRILPGAFTASRWPQCLWAHDPTRPIARVEEVEELLPGDGRLPADLRDRGCGGLMVKARFDLDDPDAVAAWRKLRHIPTMGWSIGYTVVESRPRSEPPPGRDLVAVDVLEVSPVAIPANAATRTVAVKANVLDDLRAEVESLRARVEALEHAVGELRTHTAGTADTDADVDTDVDVDDAESVDRSDTSDGESDDTPEVVDIPADPAELVADIEADLMLATVGVGSDQTEQGGDHAEDS